MNNDEKNKEDESLMNYIPGTIMYYKRIFSKLV